MSNNINKKLIAYLLATPVNHPEYFGIKSSEAVVNSVKGRM